MCSVWVHWSWVAKNDAILKYAIITQNQAFFLCVYVTNQLHRNKIINLATANSKTKKQNIFSKKNFFFQQNKKQTNVVNLIKNFIFICKIRKLVLVKIK